jgi:hypothetical protein
MGGAEQDWNERVRIWLGTATMASASLVAVMIFCDRMEYDFLPLPAVWHPTRHLHLLICGGMFLAAAILLMSPARMEAFGPKQPLFRRCRLLTRQDCHLCDAALATLLKFQDSLPAIELVDVDEDPTLFRQFGESVPVVELDGRVRFRGAVNERLLQRLVDAAETRARRVNPPAALAATGAGSQPRRSQQA